MAKAAIPAVRLNAPDRDVLGALKQNVEDLTAQSSVAIKPLDSGATLDDVIVKINQIIARLQT